MQPDRMKHAAPRRDPSQRYPRHPDTQPPGPAYADYSRPLSLRSFAVSPIVGLQLRYKYLISNLDLKQEIGELGGCHGGWGFVPGAADCCSGDAALADRIRCTYREGEKVPFSVTLFEPFFGEFVTENVIRTFSPSLLVHLIRLDTAASPEQQSAAPGTKPQPPWHPPNSPISGPRITSK